MEDNRMAELFWEARYRVSDAAWMRYQKWEPSDDSLPLGFQGARFQWAMDDPDFSVAIMTLILEGK